MTISRGFCTEGPDAVHYFRGNPTCDCGASRPPVIIPRDAYSEMQASARERTKERDALYTALLVSTNAGKIRSLQGDRYCAETICGDRENHTPECDLVNAAMQVADAPYEYRSVDGDGFGGVGIAEARKRDS